jgi:hypothetical protein
MCVMDVLYIRRSLAWTHVIVFGHVSEFLLDYGSRLIWTLPERVYGDTYCISSLAHEV